MKWISFKLAACFVLIWSFFSHCLIYAEVTEYFVNENPPVKDAPPPGDYAMPDIQSARIAYENIKQSILTEEVLSSSNALVTSGGEISFRAVKDEGAKVQGYFRNYTGVLKLSENKPVALDMLIDINSLDTAVPGRNNRILSLFFNSADVLLGSARLQLDTFELNGKTVSQMMDGAVYPATASGHLTLNGIEQPVTVALNVQKIASAWKVSSAAPLELRITDFAFNDRVAAFLKECGHRKLGNVVSVEVSLYLK